MPQNLRFDNPVNVPRLDFEIQIVETDGAVSFGRSTNASLNRSSTDDTLDNIQGGRSRTALRTRTNESMSVSLATRELKNRILLSLFHSEGRSATLKNYDQLLCQKLTKPFKSDYQASIPITAGLPQAITQFPAPASISASATGSSAIGAATYYAWVVPVFINRDPKYGITASDFTLANIANFTRGIGYVCGTPTASDSQALSGSNALQVDFQAPTSGPRPDYHFVVVGTSDDITDTESHIAAVVTFGTDSAVITALGTVDFGASPAITDFHNVEIGSISSEVRVWTPKTNATDYTFDKETGLYSVVSGGGIRNGALHRFTNWLLVENESKHSVGGSDLSELYKHIRLIHAEPTTTDPDTRRPNMIIFDLYRVNLAGLPMDMLTSNPDGYAGPLSLNLPMDVDPTQGVFAHAYVYGDDNFVDLYANDIAAAAA